MFWNSNLLTIIYGVCIFLYAIFIINRSFSGSSGLENFLRKVTGSHTKGFLFGFTATTIMQSSGLVTVLAVSFLTAGLINLVAGLSVLYGANLGTVMGAWLVAGLGLKIDIAKHAMPIVVIGLFCVTNKSDRIKNAGYFLFGVGILLLGIAYMKAGFDDIKTSIDISQYAMEGVAGLLVYTLIGIVVTAIMQSSHATLTIVITALSTGQISYENALAVAIGSNVGSTVMVVIGALGANAAGKRLTLAHVLFNSVSAVVVLVFFKFFMQATDLIAEATGVAFDDYTIKLSIFHTLFNSAGVLIFMPAIGAMARWLESIKFQSKRAKISTAHHLSEEAAKYPASALKVISQELKHLYLNATSIIAKSISISKEDLTSNLKSAEVIKLRNKPMKINFNELYQNRFKELYNQIIDYDITASLNADESNINRFMDARRIALLMAEILKDIQNVQPNIVRFMTSQNEAIRSEYDKLRADVLHILRVVNTIVELEDAGEIATKVKELKETLKEYSQNELHIAALLVNKQISASMATSLMNDNAIIASLARKFFEIAEFISTYANEVDFSDIKQTLEKVQ